MAPGQKAWLLQVCLESGAADTWEREVRALVAAAEEHPEAAPLLLTMDPTPPRTDPPDPVKWLPAAEWFLREEE